MARYFDIHPANPQRRTIAQVADIVRDGGVIAYPTDSCYALGCQFGNKDGISRIRAIRGLDDRHHLTLVCQDFAQLGQFVYVSNAIFRAIKAATPGSYTFILPATKEVPRRLQHPGKKTVGVRIPRHGVAQALLAELGEPLVSSTLLLPGEDEPMTQGWQIAGELDHALDAIIDSGDCGTDPTTVIDFSQSEPVIVRRGAGDPSAFELRSGEVLGEQGEVGGAEAVLGRGELMPVRIDQVRRADRVQRGGFVGGQRERRGAQVVAQLLFCASPDDLWPDGDASRRYLPETRVCPSHSCTW